MKKHPEFSKVKTTRRSLVALLFAGIILSSCSARGIDDVCMIPFGRFNRSGVWGYDGLTTPTFFKGRKGIKEMFTLFYRNNGTNAVELTYQAFMDRLPTGKGILSSMSILVIPCGNYPKYGYIGFETTIGWDSTTATIFFNCPCESFDEGVPKESNQPSYYGAPKFALVSNAVARKSKMFRYDIYSRLTGKTESIYIN